MRFSTIIQTRMHHTPSLLIAMLLTACAAPSMTPAPSMQSWIGELSYYKPDATHGPKGTPVRFQMSFDTKKWGLSSFGLGHVGTDCLLYAMPDEVNALDLYGSIYDIFGTNPYPDPSIYGGPATETIGEVRFITLGRATGRDWMRFGYCYADQKLPVCFVLTSSDMYEGWNEEQTKHCVPDAEDVLATLQVSPAASATPAN